MSMSVALYALADGLRRPELTLGRLRTHAEGKGWTIAAEFWDTRPSGTPRLDRPSGWADARRAAEPEPTGERTADILIVAQMNDVVVDQQTAVDLAAWAADFQVPILFMDAGYLGYWVRMGPNPEKLAELRHPPIASTACRGLLGLAHS